MSSPALRCERGAQNAPPHARHTQGARPPPPPPAPPPRLARPALQAHFGTAASARAPATSPRETAARRCLPRCRQTPPRAPRAPPRRPRACAR
eukprot:156648-Chlamydomonas_euryale.AAC.1